MKKLLFFVAASLLFIAACQKDFLQIPDTTGTVDQDKVYSNSRNATAALLVNYRRVLALNWFTQTGFYHGVLGSIAGERGKGWNWHETYRIADRGTVATGGERPINYGSLWLYIRSLWLVHQNIDRVPGMDATMKGYIKGESKGLIGYVYSNMFKAYGGVPIVDRAYLPSDDLNAPRGTLQQTLDFTVKLFDEAIAELPDEWPEDQTGRLTKGAVMAMKAQLLMYAARPLFNSATPYLDLGANNNLICFGSQDQSRWTKAITATETALQWATSHGYTLINTGGAGANSPNPKALDDYGTATSTPNNPEVILACKIDENGNAFYYNLSGYWTSSRYNNQKSGLLGNFLPNYRKADGTEQDWPDVGDATPRPAADYITRFSQMEPRFRADFAGPGVQAANNPNDNKWGPANWGLNMGNYGTSTTVFPGSYDYGAGVAYPTKFYYKAGGRLWFEYPILRVAELYLNLAEAYNEAGDPVKALQNLNAVHNRAGLPSITETDKVKLREIIQREWAVEFFNESKRYYDVRHWKLDNIGNGIIGGDILEFQFRTSGAGNRNLPANLYQYWMSKTYTAYWSPRMFLEPFPQSEIDKSAVIQNPGY